MAWSASAKYHSKWLAAKIFIRNELAGVAARLGAFPAFLDCFNCSEWRVAFRHISCAAKRCAVIGDFSFLGGFGGLTGKARDQGSAGAVAAWTSNGRGNGGLAALDTPPCDDEPSRGWGTRIRAERCDRYGILRCAQDDGKNKQRRWVRCGRGAGGEVPSREPAVVLENRAGGGCRRLEVDMAKRKLRIGVLFGGKSGEHEISLLSAASILKAIDKKKYEVVPLGITKQGQWVSAEAADRLLTGETAAWRWRGRTVELRSRPALAAKNAAKMGHPGLLAGRSSWRAGWRGDEARAGAGCGVSGAAWDVW